VTPEVQARVACGAQIRVNVTLLGGDLDGSTVRDIAATCIAIDRREDHALHVVTDDGRKFRIPLEPIEAAVLPLPRPTPGGAT
jgi:hypothetical protein